MNAYYIDLTRETILKAIEHLSRTQQYMVQAEELESDYEYIGKIIAKLIKEHNILGGYLLSGLATRK